MRTASLGRRLATLGLVPLLAISTSVSGPLSGTSGVFQPLIDDMVLIGTAPAPPTETDCFNIGRRCFNPISMRKSYNLDSVISSGMDGTGQTIVLVDSFGSATIQNDLNLFDTAFGLPHMCGEAGVTCKTGMPRFSMLQVQGNPPAVPPPTNNGTGQEAHNLWAREVSLDVEWAHSIAPGANILLVTTPTAETLGVQGFPQMMNAEQFVIDHHLGSVISQSFGAAEESFGSSQSLQNLRGAFQSAQKNGITVLASSGDFGTANIKKEPVKNPAVIPFPTVIWPASDPLVTAVGGTYLCTEPTAGSLTADSADPPTNCKANPGQREVGWIDSGGGFSHVFGIPTFQTSLPAGSTPVTGGRGVPDVGYQASSRTGVLIYDTDEQRGGGWFIIGGTSSGSPQWAALVAIADQINGGSLGYINPALYKIGSDPARYAKGLLRRDGGQQRRRCASRTGLFRHNRLGPSHRTGHPQRRQPAAGSGERG